MSLPAPLEGKYIVRPNGCWEWVRAIQSQGYGSVGYQGRTFLAHRLSYMLAVGPIPAEHDLHHKCNNRRCINPKHLQPLKRVAHFRLSDSPFSRNAFKTHCAKGHALEGTNLFIDTRGRRQCRECTNAMQRRRRAERAAIRNAEKEARYEA